MGQTDTEAIVLRTYKLAEADKIVVCLTRRAGLIRAVARGARRLKSKFGAGLEPFTVLQLSYHEKEGRELVTLRHTEIVQSYFNLANDSEAVAALSQMCDLVMQFAPPHEPNEKLYRMVTACLEAVNSTPTGWREITRYFEVWLLKLSGFLPDTRSCAECSRRFGVETVYGNAESKLRCYGCSAGIGIALSQEAYTQLEAIQRLPPLEFARSAQGVGESPGGEMAQFTRRAIARVLEREPRALPSTLRLMSEE